MEAFSSADYFFEGPEKNLEVWFHPTAAAATCTLAVPPMNLGQGEYERHGLRLVARSLWEELLKDVHCTILSSYHDEHMDSYVLSESSMFVTPYRFILKTCGQTTLLHALPKLLEYAKGVGLPDIQEMFFSRHHLGRPEEQHYPHKSFSDEVEYLDRYFDGKAFSLGRINDNDTCYLYTLDNHHDFVPVPEQADQTLEILMSELDPAAMVPFYKSDTVTNFEQSSVMSGISALFPEAKLDGHLFEPCGYSVNAMIGPYYFTIHITPQPGFSYASFETDYPLEDYSELTSRVLAIFRPGRSTVTVMANHAARYPARVPRQLEDYVAHDVQHQELAQYKIVYARLRKASAERRATPPRLSPRPLAIQTSA